MIRKAFRRQYLIDKPFQVKFILKFCVVVLVSSILVGSLIFFLFQNSTTVAIENTKVVVKSTSDFILPLVAIILLVVTIVAAFVVLIMTLLMSHKISGPLFRMKREIDFLKEGDLNRNFSIRNKDQLQGLSKSLNEMCGSLKAKQTELKKKTDVLKSYLENKNFYIKKEEKDEFVNLLNELESIVNYFKI
ncbi:MAG: methyl-accepting chemotaxis protein [Candidatus Omnitrophota bacterium]